MHADRKEAEFGAIASMSDADRGIEAARYALLRRLAPAIRHGLGGKLHLITLMAAILERQLASVMPDMAAVQGDAAKLKDMSRSTMGAGGGLMSWFAPEPETIELGSGIGECLELLTTDFNMRGFTIENHATDIPCTVSKTALRTVLPAALLAATDAAPVRTAIAISAERLPDEAVISILMRPAGTESPAASTFYRRLEWEEAQVLARAEKVRLSRNADCITLRCPIAKS